MKVKNNLREIAFSQRKTLKHLSDETGIAYWKLNRLSCKGEGTVRELDIPALAKALNTTPEQLFYVE